MTKCKEYLDPDNGYALITADDEIKGSSNWIEVPDGADTAVICRNNIIFWKGKDLSFVVELDSEFNHASNGFMTFDYFMEFNKKDNPKIIWQRSETKKVEGGKSQWDIQVGGDHYKSMKIQPAKFALENKLDYCQANAIKYICRHESKNGKQDLEKAKHYIDLLIEHYYGNS